MSKDDKMGCDYERFRFGAFNMPDQDDLIEISESVKNVLNKSSGEVKKQKTTYSISPVATTLIKEFAEECGVTQGGIVELAPLLFRVIASESLERRKNGFSSIKKMASQIISNLNSMEEIAPQLSSYSDFIKKCVNELVQLELSAIEEKNYKGVDASKSKILSQVKKEKNEIAFHKDVQKILSRDKNIENIFNTMK